MTKKIDFFDNTVGLTGISANGTVGTAGQVLKSNGTTTYWDADAASGGDAATLDGYDSTAFARLAANTPFTATQTISLNPTAGPTTPTGTLLHLIGNNAVQSRMFLDTFGQNAAFLGRRANGTNALPTRTLSGDFIFTFGGFGYGNTGYIASASALGLVTATENFTDTAAGAKFSFRTTPNGTVTPVVRWHIENDGSFIAEGLTVSGNGTINAVDYFDNGTNINTIYSSLTGATFTGNIIVNKSGVAVPTAFGTDEIRIVGNTGNDALIWADSFGGPPVFGGRRAEGTPGSPSAVQAGNTLVALRGYGYGASAYSAAHRGSVSVLASENWSNTAQGTRIVLATTANTTAGQSARWLVENDGSFIYNGGSLTGVSTVNAVDYFDNGVNINTIYGSLGLTNTWTQVKTINRNSAAVPTAITDTILHISQADGLASRVTVDSFAAAGVVTFRRANGTNASKTALSATDFIGAIAGLGYGATGYSAGARGQISFRAAETWTDAAQGTRIQFLTTSNLSIVGTNRWAIENDGSFVYEGGSLTGVSTINAIDYFDNGVNINTIYGSLALANIFTAAQTINQNAVALPAPPSPTALHIGAADAGLSRATIDAFGSSASIALRRASGTNASKTALALNETIGNIVAFGYGTTGYSATLRAGIAFQADEAWTDAAQGTRITFTTTPNLSTAAAARWIVENDGSFIYNGGSLTGVGTVNAIDYFDNGTNINTIYASLSGAGFTGAITVNTTAATAATFYRTDEGASGPVINLQHITTTPAINDATGQLSFILTDASLGTPTGAAIRGVSRDITAGAASGDLQFLTRVSGSLGTRFTLANGLYMAGATGSDQGTGTINAVNYFDDGTNINTIYASLSGATFSGNITVSNAAPFIDIIDSNAAADVGKWRIDASLDALGFYAYNDAASTFNSFLTVTRSGAAIGNINFFGGSAITYNRNAVAAPTPPTNTAIHIVQSDSNAARITIDTFGGAGNITFRRANGTNASKTAVANNDTIGNIIGFGYGSGSYSSTGRITQSWLAAEDWTDAAQGTKFSFSVTTNGTTGLAERWVMDHDGSLRASGLAATGNNTINAVNYFDDGTNINTIYGSLATVNTWQLLQTYNAGIKTTASGPATHISIERTGASPSLLTIANLGNQIDFDYNVTGYRFLLSGSPRLVITGASTFTYNGNAIWHQGNMGTGTGLDADLWDNNQFADYLNQAVKTTSTPTFGGVNLLSATSFLPQISVKNTNDDANAGYVIFRKTPADTLVSASDYIGTILWYGHGSSTADGTAATIFAQAQGTRGTNWVASDLYLGSMSTAGSYRYLRINADGTFTYNGNTIWTSGNMVIGTNVQAWDADLDSWATVTRASGFDTFVATPSGANFASLLTSALPVSKGGTNATSAGIAAFNNITGYTAAGATGTTSTNLVFSTSPTITTPLLSGQTIANNSSSGVATTPLILRNAFSANNTETVLQFNASASVDRFAQIASRNDGTNNTGLILRTGSGGTLTDAISITGFGVVTLSSGAVIPSPALSGTISGTPTYSGTPAFSAGLTAGTTNTITLGTDGNIEIFRSAGFAFIDFKNASGDDFDIRIQQSGANTMDLIASGGLTHNSVTIPTISSSHTFTNKIYDGGAVQGTFTGAATWTGTQTFLASGAATTLIIGGAVDFVPALRLTSNAGQDRRVNFFTSNTSGSTIRWSLLVSNAAESGSNAGSNFSIQRFDDAGTFIDQPFAITRNTGAISITTPTTISTTGIGTLLSVTSSNGDATAHGIDIFRNSTTPAVNDVVGELRFLGKDSGTTTIPYGRVYTTIVDPTAGSLDSSMIFDAYANNVSYAPLTLGLTENEHRFTTPTSSIVTSRGTNGYGSFYARGSGTNPAYMFFGNDNATAERARITVNNAGDFIVSTNGGTANNFKVDSSGVITTNGNTIWHAGNDGDGTSLDAGLLSSYNHLKLAYGNRANRSITGGGTITVNSLGSVLWGSRFIVISSGRGTSASTSGYFDINCPTSGSITGVGGAASVTADAAGIPLAAWQALYYILPIGSNNTSLAANFRVVGFTADVDIPHDWVLICLRNGDNDVFYFNNGIQLKVNGVHTAGTVWNSGNDGPASGLNADLLDDYNESSFWRVNTIRQGDYGIARASSSNDVFGGLEIRENALVSNTQSTAIYAPGINFHWGNIAAARIYMNASGQFVLGGQTDITVNRRDLLAANVYSNGNLVWHAGSLSLTAFTARVTLTTGVNGTLTASHANISVELNGNVTLPNSVFTAGDKTVFDPGTSARTFTRGSGIAMYVNGVDVASATLAANQIGGAHWRTASVVILTGAFT